MPFLTLGTMGSELLNLVTFMGFSFLFFQKILAYVINHRLTKKFKRIKKNKFNYLIIN
jgi:hypothetical protein